MPTPQPWQRLGPHGARHPERSQGEAAGPHGRSLTDPSPVVRRQSAPCRRSDTTNARRSGRHDGRARRRSSSAPRTAFRYRTTARPSRTTRSSKAARTRCHLECARESAVEGGGVGQNAGDDGAPIRVANAVGSQDIRSCRQEAVARQPGCGGKQADMVHAAVLHRSGLAEADAGRQGYLTR
jgi:hypothetical protein